jgi:selenocysteine lyase/cysteine desulfurase
MSEGPLGCQVALFSLPRGVHYLNCAFQAPLMKSVEAAAVTALLRLRSPIGLSADDYFADAERARILFARLIGADDPDGVALVPSVSYGVAIAARNVRVRRGQNVLIAQGQFSSNVHTWKRLCGERGAELRIVPGVRAAEAIDSRTAVVALGTIDWTDGTVYDLEAIGARAREVSAAYVLDGTQSVGAMPFDVRGVRPDFLVCSSYKWLLGPMGLGLCYVSKRFRKGVPLEETWLGRRGSEDFARLTEYCEEYQTGARRFDAGGRAQFVSLPMLNAALTQLLRWDPARVQDYCERVGAPLREELRETGFGVSDDTSQHLFAIQPRKEISAEGLYETLRKRGVYVSVRGGALRVSINVFNSCDDVAAVLDVLGECGALGMSPRRGVQ